MGALSSGFSRSLLDSPKALKEEEAGGFIRGPNRVERAVEVKFHRREQRLQQRRTTGGDGNQCPLEILLRAEKGGVSWMLMVIEREGLKSNLKRWREMASAGETVAEEEGGKEEELRGPSLRRKGRKEKKKRRKEGRREGL